MAINKRLFGAPVQGLVKKKLEDRQTPKGVLEYNGKTSFARMWTNVKFLSKESFIAEGVEGDKGGQKADNKFEIEFNADGTVKDGFGDDPMIESYKSPDLIAVDDNSEKEFIDLLNALPESEFKPDFSDDPNVAEGDEKQYSSDSIEYNDGGNLNPIGKGSVDETNRRTAKDGGLQNQNYDLDGTVPIDTSLLSEDDARALAEMQSGEQEKNKIIPENYVTLNPKQYATNPKVYGNYTRPFDVQKTYVVGDDNYNEYLKIVDANTNQPIQDDYRTINEDESVTSNQAFQDVFPKTSKQNPLLKPQAGITSINSTTEGSLGLIKKTTVEFMVHNFYDFDKIFNKFFLKPGAQLFVDFGWSDMVELYSPDKLINHPKGVEDFLYAEAKDGDDFEGIITKNQGSLETIFGMVTDYDATVEKNGSVKCSVTITSTNSTLLDGKNNKKFKNEMSQAMEEGLYYYSLKKLSQKTTDPNDQKQFERRFMPHGDSTEEEYSQVKKGLQKEFKQTFGESNSITTLGSQFGVYAGDSGYEDVYITWGMFEDYLINGYLGFGNGIKEINYGSNFQVRMDSSDSYTSWSKIYDIVLQQRLSNSEKPAVLFPKQWGYFTPKDSQGKVLGEDIESYSYRVKKYPNYNAISEREDKGLNHYLEDTKNNSSNEFGRMPLREVFINMNHIKSAFNNSENQGIREIIHNILEKINESTNNLFDWGMVVGNTDTQIKIIDKNYAIRKEIHEKGVDWFIFDTMSPNSQIIDYNLGFKIPSGNLGDYYAISGMSYEDSIFTLDKDVRDAVAALSIDLDTTSISYQPDIYGYRAEQKLNHVNQPTFTTIYNKVDDLMQTDSLHTLNDIIVPSGEKVDSVTLYNKRIKSGTGSNNKEADVKVDYVLNNNKEMRSNNFLVAQNYTQYLDYLCSNSVNSKGVGLLPYTLEIKINGISSIVPGDTFKVNYLPQAYRNKTFLQTMRVEHNVNSDGWYTTLQTQFRELFPGLKNNIFKSFDLSADNIRLSANALTSKPFNIKSRGIGPFISKKVKEFFEPAGIDFLKNIITEAKLDIYYTGYFDQIFDIKINNVKEVMGDDYDPQLGHIPDGGVSSASTRKATYPCAGFLDYSNNTNEFNLAKNKIEKLGLKYAVWGPVGALLKMGDSNNVQTPIASEADFLIPTLADYHVTSWPNQVGKATDMWGYEYDLYSQNFSLANAPLIDNQKYKLVVKRGLYALIGPYSDSGSTNTGKIIKTTTRVENIIQFYDWVNENKDGLHIGSTEFWEEWYDGKKQKDD